MDGILRGRRLRSLIELSPPPSSQPTSGETRASERAPQDLYQIVPADGRGEYDARFVMECNQTSLPLVFLQDVQGFMVGRRAEQSGIIRSGAKLVNVVSNSVVPKLTVILGGSFGAGNYALCGKAYDPWLMLAWPSARYAVMGADQAADTLLQLHLRDADRAGRPLPEEETERRREEIRRRYEEQTDIRYGAARGWVDAIVAPHETRHWLAAALTEPEAGSDATNVQTTATLFLKQSARRIRAVLHSLHDRDNEVILQTARQVLVCDEAAR